MKRKTRPAAKRRAKGTPKAVPKPRRPSLHLLDALGRPTTAYGVGDSLTVRAVGLRPSALHDLQVSAGPSRPLVETRLLTTSEGQIPAVAVWPQIGLEGRRGRGRSTVLAAEKTWRGRRLLAELLFNGRRVAAKRLRIEPSRSFVVSGDAEEGPVNSFEVGTRPIAVHCRLPAGIRQARVFLVTRRFGWAIGDAFGPAPLRGGRPAYRDVEVGRDGTFTAELAAAHETRVGAYDVLVRPLRYGYMDEEDLHVREGDVFTPAGTGVVVREPYIQSKPVRGGCTNVMPISGRSLSGSPYFQYADTFQVGEDVYAALDPLARNPNVVGKMVALYVIPHKTEEEWNASHALQHLGELGGNGSVQVLKVQPECINFNKRLVWPKASKPGLYDIVADLGNDPAQEADFKPDATYDTDKDIIDGFYLAGFRVVEDPGESTTHTGAGIHDYTGPDIELEEYGDKYMVTQKGVVFFPADQDGVSSPGEISAQGGPFPLVVFVHGNSSNDESYRGYDYLLKHLAMNGFIAASVYSPIDFNATSRARILLAHIPTLQGLFGGSVADSIGIMGHSRGGEGVATAVRLNFQENLKRPIKAALALAPTDQYTHEEVGGDWATPFFVVYGSMDGDVQGVPETGFSLYDRARGAPKSMLFVYGAGHGGFNSKWTNSVDVFSGDLAPVDFPQLLKEETHEETLKAYATAFFRWHLRGDDALRGLFWGEWVPASVSKAENGKAKLFFQFEDPGRRVVDDFEEAHTADSWKTSTAQDAVDDGGTLAQAPVEADVANLDPHSPHETGGLFVQWQKPAGKLRFNVPTGLQDVRGYQAVSLRVTQKVDSGLNEADVDQDFYLTLRDRAGKQRAVRVVRFGRVPPPHRRGYNQYTKSALCTVRVPLHAFTIKVFGVESVDLSQVESVTLEFDSKPTGEIAIDDLAFH